jgi:N-acetylgalactosamine-6-sulfatase
MKFKQFFVAVAGLFLSLSAFAAEQKPNIIFIFADDWGYGDLGIHGSTFCRTPRIDRMAAEGIDFQNFTVSNPVCSPSRAAVMTGHFPARNSVHAHFASSNYHMSLGMPDWLDPTVPMMPRILKVAGYATAHFGKWHLSNDHIPDAPMPPAYGYDEFGAHNLPGDAPEQMNPAETCPRTIDFSRRHKDRPFFINMWLHETHTPHYPLEEYLAQFEDLDEREEVYAAIVAEGDAKVGKVLDTLKELGLDEKTLVIFSSDNGPESGSETANKKGNGTTGPGLGAYYSVGETGGLRGRKRSTFAGGVRVPFVARWPGVIPPGKTDRASVLTAVDLLPTFARIAGAELPAGYEPDGVDIMPALKGEPFERGKPIFWEWKKSRGKGGNSWPHLAVRDGKWKLFLNDAIGKAELYDIENDWAESTDVSREHPEVVEALAGRAREWKATLPTEPPASCISKFRGM